MATKKTTPKKQETKTNADQITTRNSAKKNTQYAYDSGRGGGFSIVEVQSKSGINLSKLRTQLKSSSKDNDIINSFVVSILEIYLGLPGYNSALDSLPAAGRGILFLKELGIIED